MIYKFLAATSPLVFVIPLIVSLITHKSQSRLLRIICKHIYVVTIVEVISHWLWMQKRNNLFLLHAYVVWELEIISLFYLVLLKQSMKRWIIPIIMIGFLLFAVIDSIFFHDLQHFNVFARSVECIIIIYYTIFYLYKQLLDGKDISLRYNPVMLINTAFLFYFSVSFFLFLFSNYIMVETFKTYMVWTMHTIVAWIYYTTIGIALWKAGRK